MRRKDQCCEECNRLRELAAPFVRHYAPFMDEWADDIETSSFARVTFGQMRALRAAIETGSTRRVRVPGANDSLLPCLLCNGPGHLTRFNEPHTGGRGWHVVCHGDDRCMLYCSTPYSVSSTRGEAISRWNNPLLTKSGSRERTKNVQTFVKTK
jgi:hypothetical protein